MNSISKFEENKLIADLVDKERRQNEFFNFLYSVRVKLAEQEKLSEAKVVDAIIKKYRSYVLHADQVH